jgi:predicted dinucleotide-binding enzyme
MRIGIVGTNDRALAIGRFFRSCGHAVTFGDPEGPEQAKRAAALTGAGSEPPYRQAMKSDLLLFAVPRTEVDRAVTAVGGSRTDAVIVDVIDGKDRSAARSGAEALARKLDSDRVVRALINIPQSGTNVPLCGDDPTAKKLVGKALQACGCLVTDRGPLVNAAEIEPPA